MRTHDLVVWILTVGSLSACSSPEASAPKPLPPVKTYTVAETVPDSSVRYSASIEAFEQVPLAFKTSGYVEQVLRRTGADGRTRALQPGDRIGRGAVLARVQERDYRDRVNQSRARLAEAEAGMVKARLDLERARTLFQSDSLTKPELDAAQAAFDSADARIIAARADLELASSALSDTALVSPGSGVILERRIEVGSLASAGTVAFVLGDLGSVKARFGIPDGMVQSVRLGDAIGVTVEGLGAASFSGRVTAVAPVADAQSRVFDVEVTIGNGDGRLRPGMIGTVAISQAGPGRRAAASRLAVPLTAVVRSEAAGAQFAVLVVERQSDVDVARVRHVELGEVLGNAITVLKGLRAGEQVIVSGATLLVDGNPVRVLPE
jgi:RND family efflux transporter MFP subunit